MTPERYQKLKDTLALRQPDLTVLLEGVTKPHNLAAIMRTCDAVGVLEVNAVAERGALKRRPKAAAGSRRWIKSCLHESVTRAFSALRESGHQMVVAHPTPDSIPYTEYDFTRPTAIIFGTELHGLSDYSIEHADAAIHVPMLGMCESLNVSVSAALILYEAKRQRREAGVYQHCRLEKASYEKTLFEWAWPQIAHYCKVKKIPYPEFNSDNGDIIGTIPGSAGAPWEDND
jgi:tRNA (guanosine-2'-O-)-methyltransferase